MSKQGVFMRAMASDASTAVIDIVGVIGWDVAYTSLRDMLRAIPQTVKRVEFDIYSPGGSVWDGNGIVTEIGELGKRAETVARVQVAASMATLIAVACQKRSIASNGRFLVHNAWTETVGDAAEHEKAAKTLRDTEQEAAKFYAERCGKKPEEMLALMAEERWLMPDEAKTWGFVQEVCDPFKPEEYEAVKQEIVAAGKWPTALVEIKKESVMEVKPNEPTAAAGAAPVAPVVAPVEPQPAAEPAAQSPDEYKRGLADGEVKGRADSVKEYADKLAELTKKLAAVQAEASKYQSERDKLTAELDKANKAAEQRAAEYRAQLAEMTERLSKYVAGALTYTPDVETWEDAMRECGGDYAAASKKYPHLKEKYVAEKKQNGRK